MKIKLLCTAILLLISGVSSAAGIPVYCYNCQEASHNAAHAILDGLRSQTEALANAMDYTMRTELKLSVARDVAIAATEQKIKNSYAMEPSLGAKPRPACGQLRAASLRAVADSSAPVLKKVYATRTKRHNEVGRSLSQKEPRKDYNIKEVITVLDDPKTVEYAKVIMSDEPIDATSADALAKRRRIQEVLLNPFPVESPSKEDIERIKKSGSPGEQQALAESIALQRRQEVGQYVHDQEFERNTQRIDAKELSYMLKDIKRYLSADEKKLLNGKLSPNQLNELMATYRVKSEAWIRQAVTSLSPEMHQREQTLMQAQMLDQLFRLERAMVQALKISSFDAVRDVSQSGMQSK